LTALWHWEQKYPAHKSKHVELSKILAKIPVKKESAKKPEAVTDIKKYKTFSDRFEKSEVPMCSK